MTEVIRDENGKIVDARTILANDAAIKFTGLDKEVYLSKTAKEIDPHIMEGPMYQLVTSALETGNPFHTQYFLELTNRWLEVSVSKMDEDRLVNVFSDITGTKEAQLNVERMAERFFTVINSARAGMFTLKVEILRKTSKPSS